MKRMDGDEWVTRDKLASWAAKRVVERVQRNGMKEALLFPPFLRTHLAASDQGHENEGGRKGSCVS